MFPYTAAQTRVGHTSVNAFIHSYLDNDIGLFLVIFQAKLSSLSCFYLFSIDEPIHQKRYLMGGEPIHRFDAF